jgi:hypothetical protein
MYITNSSEKYVYVARSKEEVQLKIHVCTAKSDKPGWIPVFWNVTTRVQFWRGRWPQQITYVHVYKYWHFGQEFKLKCFFSRTIFIFRLNEGTGQSVLVNLIKQFDQVAHTYIQILQAFA